MDPMAVQFPDRVYYKCGSVCWVCHHSPILEIKYRDSVHENRRTCRTFPMARAKCLMRDFMNFNRIYKAHSTIVWWTMKVFRLHCRDAFTHYTYTIQASVSESVSESLTELCLHRSCVHGNHRTCRTFPMAWLKCLMRDFRIFHKIYITPIGQMSDEPWKIPLTLLH